MSLFLFAVCFTNFLLLMASVAEDRAMLALDKQLKLNEVGKLHISTPSLTWIVLLRLHFKHK